MLPAARINLKDLAGLCRRVAIGVESGIDDRKIWAREADRGSGRLQQELRAVGDAVSRGQSITDAMAQAGDVFPPLVHDMVTVGETTGHLADVFRRLAEHYEHQLQLRRALLAGLVWPLTELALAVAVVGLLIWIMGVLGGVDILGWGLVGTKGLAVYVTGVGLAAAAVGGLLYAIRRGALWTRPLQHAALHLPAVGRCLRTFAMARFTWTLQLTLDVGMDLRRALPMAFTSTGNDYYARHAADTVADITAGCAVHETLRHTGALPVELLDAVEVAEESGRLTESLKRLSSQYAEQARTALATLSVVGGYLIWALVAAIIIALIFRLASFYLGTINELANPRSFR